MKLFTGREYLQIDIVNNFGLDKKLWEQRLEWFAFNEHRLEELIEKADEPYLMAKGVIAYRDMQAGKPSGYNMHLDCTASGLQWMAILSGCLSTAKAVNLVNTGKREDVYLKVSEEMNELLSPIDQVTRKLVKSPLMTHYYNKVEHEEFNENQANAFYQALRGSFTGAEEVKELVNEFWDSEALEHSFTMPDGHRVICKVKEVVDARIEVDELEGVTFTYRFTANQASSKSSSLMPNLIHAIDAYAVREMVRRAEKQGFELAHIHDAFTFHPNYGNKVRKNFQDILCEIADSDLLADILSQISGEKIIIDKTINNLSDYIRKAEYFLS